MREAKKIGEFYRVKDGRDAWLDFGGFRTLDELVKYFAETRPQYSNKSVVVTVDSLMVKFYEVPEGAGMVLLV